MALYTGRLERVDIGPGAWILQTDDGRVDLDLTGVTVDARPLVGQRVEVRGQSGAMGFGMSGNASVTVTSLRPAPR